MLPVTPRARALPTAAERRRCAAPRLRTASRGRAYAPKLQCDVRAEMPRRVGFVSDTMLLLLRVIARSQAVAANLTAENACRCEGHHTDLG